VFDEAKRRSRASACVEKQLVSVVALGSSLAISAGANVKAVQRMLGHASAAMTLDTYADLFDDDLDAVAVALNDARRASIAVRSFGSRDLRGQPPSIY